MTRKPTSQCAGVLALLAWTCGVAAADLSGTIDLDAPDAMRALATRSPDHHARIVRLIAATEHADCWSRELDAIKVALDVRELDCAMVLKTSDPPQRALSFTLDGTVYRKRVVLDVQPTLRPLR